MLCDRSIYTEALFKRPDSLSDLLPYEDYYEKEKVFILKDGSLGVIYEVDLVEHEPLTEKQILATIKSLKPWLTLPENCTMQFIHEQARVSSLDSRIEELSQTYPDAHPVSKILFDKKKIADAQSKFKLRFRPK